jgi:sugar phosphate isomerase/epimerase
MGEENGREMERYNENIVACYLYTITRHGYPPVAEDAAMHLDEFSKLGFSSVELEGIREEHLRGMYEQRQELRTRADELGLKVPVFCTVLPGLCSPERKEREANLERFARGCEVAEALGSTIVLDNAPLPPWVFPEGIPVTRHYDDEVLAAATIPAGLVWEDYWDALVETFREVCDIAAAKNLSYHLHPCHGALVNSTDAHLLFASAVKRDNLKFNLDTANQHFLKDNLFLSLLRLRDHIDYIHISDNGGGRVEHLAMGEGTIHWERFLETLDRIDYKGKFGIDIGGAESAVPDLDRAYGDAAAWLEDKWFKI